jgi:acyl-CoA reductase-like NAD-dependent aldehyde dehydrogenase
MSPLPRVLAPHEATVPDAGTESARRAQAAWAQASVRERLAFVRRFRRLLADAARDLVAVVDSARTRAPGETLSAEVLPLADAARYLERHADEILRSQRPRGATPFWLGRSRLQVERIPWGVVLIIGPSNYPLLLPGVQALQALVAGNAVIVKPGSGGLGAMQKFAALLDRAGLPGGLLTVAGEGADQVADALAAGVDRVVMTGGPASGRAVLRQAAETLTPVTAELSGSDAVFVLPGADLHLLSRALRFGLLLNSGGTCIAPRRVFVPRDQLEALESEIVAVLGEVAPVGLPGDRCEAVASLLHDALDRGARVLAGGAVAAESIPPTVLTDVPADAALLHRDVFAPVLSLIPVTDVEEALEMDGHCPFSLGASVFGPDTDARALARRIEAGVVVLNDLIAPTADPRVPFGGGGESGFGLTRGAEGLVELTRARVVIERPGRFRPHYDEPSPATARLLEGWLWLAHGATLRSRVRGFRDLLGALMARARGPATETDIGTDVEKEEE